MLNRILAKKSLVGTSSLLKRTRNLFVYVQLEIEKEISSRAFSKSKSTFIRELAVISLSLSGPWEPKSPITSLSCISHLSPITLVFAVCTHQVLKKIKQQSRAEQKQQSRAEQKIYQVKKNEDQVRCVWQSWGHCVLLCWWSCSVWCLWSPSSPCQAREQTQAFLSSPTNC